MKIDAFKPYPMYAHLTGHSAAPGLCVPHQECAATVMSGKCSSHTDTVSISGQSAAQGDFGRILQRLAAQAHASAPQSRIDDLRQQVESGQYTVSSGDLADAILRSAILG